MGSLRDRVKGKKSSSGTKEPPREPLVDDQVATNKLYVGSVDFDQAATNKLFVGTKDGQEREKEANEKHIILKGTVPRIFFGRVLSPAELSGSEHAEGYVIGLGERPKNARGTLKLVKSQQKEDDGDSVYRQLMDVVPLLRSHSLEIDSGPYSDQDGTVARFSQELFKDVKDGDMLDSIERVIDTRPLSALEFPRLYNPPLYFRFNQELMVPDELVSAGIILSQKRLVEESATGGASFLLVHPLEPYLIAVSALRQRGFDAYPAQAVLPGEDGGEIRHPLIAVVDLERDKPLTTFGLMREHPQMGSVDILSDVAVRAATYAMLAETRVKHMTVEMIKLYKEQGKTMSPEELHLHFDRIARALFYCEKGWDGSPFISRALTYLHIDVAGALIAIDPGMSSADQEAKPIIDGPSMMRLPSLAETTAGRFVEHVQLLLGKRITEAEKA